MGNVTIKPKTMCERCRSNLIHKSKFKMNDSWMSLEMMCTLLLVTKALNENKYHIKYGNDPEGINKIQCLGCFLPDKLNDVIKIAKEDKTLGKLKEEVEKARNGQT